MQKYWRIQDPDKPLFPEIIWEKPEQRDMAGNLLMIGGCAQSLHNVAVCYQKAISALIGRCTVILPESLRKVTDNLNGIIYAPSNQIGSFAKTSLNIMLYTSSNHDATILSGDLGKNSETAIVLSDFLHNYHGPLIITNDTVDILYPDTKYLLKRDKTFIFLTYKQLQKIAIENKETKAFSHNLSLVQLIKQLHEFTKNISAMIVTKFQKQLIVAYQGEVISTQRDDLMEDFCNDIATMGSVNIIQHGNKYLKAVATACIKNQ